jgi:hypothetical protein
MAGHNGNKWTAPQLTLMEEMHAAGRKWPTISKAVGHPINSCQQMLSRSRAQKRRLQEQALRAQIVRASVARAPSLVPKDKAMPLKVLVTDAPYQRPTSTAKFLMDAELRARIGEQGVTAGLLGDPLPGRSALDKRRAGIVEQPGYRNWYLPKPVTLPTEPMKCGGASSGGRSR